MRACRLKGGLEAQGPARGLGYLLMYQEFVSIHDAMCRVWNELLIGQLAPSQSVLILRIPHPMVLYSFVS